MTEPNKPGLLPCSRERAKKSFDALFIFVLTEVSLTRTNYLMADFAPLDVFRALPPLPLSPRREAFPWPHFPRISLPGKAYSGINLARNLLALLV